MLPGVDRPALAVTIPTRTGAAVLLDAGANLECRPEHLVQFGLMGAAYARVALDIAEPRVGLLSIGEEAGKGNDLMREAHDLLAAQRRSRSSATSTPAQLFSGDADVIVCDGFTGNIALKVGEGLAELIERMLGDELGLPAIARCGPRRRASSDSAAASTTRSAARRRCSDWPASRWSVTAARRPRRSRAASSWRPALPRAAWSSGWPRRWPARASAALLVKTP